MNRLNNLKSMVNTLYQKNRQQGYAKWCNKEYDFVCPSITTYPFQWFWDSCFHAIVLTHIDITRAEQEIRTLLINACPDGFIPHVTFWEREKYEGILSTYSIAYKTPYLSDCIQPPVLADAILIIMERGGSRQFLEDVLPSVRRYYDYLHNIRDPDRDGLIAILQPDESGLDHSPKYDRFLGITSPTHAQMTAGWKRVADQYAEVGRDPSSMFELDTFVVEDVLVNTIYAEGQRALASLLERVGLHEESQEMHKRARKTITSLLGKCFDYDTGLFFDLVGSLEYKAKVNTISSLMPILLPEIPDFIVERIVREIEDVTSYGAPFPIPTVSMREPSFSPWPPEPSLVWRGTVWINTNWYICRGLRRHGFDALATKIEDASLSLIETSGFREHFNPLTAEGYGAYDFSWSALVLDMMMR